MAIMARFRSARPVPDVYRSRFLHLYLDVAWYGVLSGSALAFLAVFATRQGATAWQLGLLSAGPAVVSLLFTLPAGRWLQTRPVDGAVFWTSVFHRVFYLFWVPLPVLFSPQGQVWALIALTLLMSVPGTGLAVGFNALFAAAVPEEWRGHVVGVRNALLAVTYIVTSLLAGFILERLPFRQGYQVVFALGFLGAAMSSLHLWFVRANMTSVSQPSGNRYSLGDHARPGVLRVWGDGVRAFVGLRFLLGHSGSFGLRRDLVRTPYGKLLAVLFAFHLTQYLAIPVFPLYWVNALHLTDRQISLGTALFYVAVLLGSTQLARLTARLGNRRLSALGAILMSAYPALTAASRGVELFLVTSFVGGIAWSLVGGALGNFLLERVPAENRPVYLAWYNLALNAAILLGSLAGPLLANSLGLSTALAIFAVSRLVSAWLIWRG